MTFIDKSIRKIAEIIKINYVQWETSEKKGFFQKLDPRIKIIFLIYFAVIISIKKDIVPELAISAFIFIIIVLSRLPIFQLYKKILFFGFLFGFLIAVPAALNIIVDGEIIFNIINLPQKYSFWIYEIPENIGITREGCTVVIILTLRVINSLSLALLIIYTTHFFDIIKALNIFKVPDTFIMIIMLSHKYIFIFSRTVEDMYLAIKSRLSGSINESRIRDIIAGRIFFIFKRSRSRYEEIYKAMLCRGFTGDVKFYSFKRIVFFDVLIGIFLFISGLIFIYI